MSVKGIPRETPYEVDGELYECTCGCHVMGGLHIVECCFPCPDCKVWVRKGQMDEHKRERCKGPSNAQ